MRRGARAPAARPVREARRRRGLRRLTVSEVPRAAGRELTCPNRSRRRAPTNDRARPRATRRARPPARRPSTRTAARAPRRARPRVHLFLLRSAFLFRTLRFKQGWTG